MGSTSAPVTLLHTPSTLNPTSQRRGGQGQGGHADAVPGARARRLLRSGLRGAPREPVTLSPNPSLDDPKPRTVNRKTVPGERSFSCGRIYLYLSIFLSVCLYLSIYPSMSIYLSISTSMSVSIVAWLQFDRQRRDAPSSVQGYLTRNTPLL